MNNEKIDSEHNPLEFELLEGIRKDIFYWTVELNSFFDIKENDNHNPHCGIDYIDNLIEKLETLQLRTNTIHTKLNSVMITTRYLSKYKKASVRLLNSTDLGQLKVLSNIPLKDDLIKLLKSDECHLSNKLYFIALINGNLKENWVAFNQSYARLLFKTMNLNQLNFSK